MRNCLWGGVAAMVFVSLTPVSYSVAMAADLPANSPVHCQIRPEPVAAVAPKGKTSVNGNAVVVTGVRSQLHTARMEKRAPPPPLIQATIPPAPPIAMLPSISYAAAPMQAGDTDRERYEHRPVATVQRVADAPVSTFSVDVDTASYANVRRMLKAGDRPQPDAVRTEELLNYFRYDYPLPQDKTQPFSISTDVTTTPWNPNTRLVRIGLRAYDVARNERPAANLVFLVDVSGSMSSPDKLPLVKSALTTLSDNLRRDDHVSIVVYAGAAGLVLSPTSNSAYVKQALECLSAGGSTAGGAGLTLAYATAKAAFIPGGINRVILATDGDFNVGTTGDEGLLALVRNRMKDGITLTTLGFGSGNYNDQMMEKIADAGNGNYAYIDSQMEAQKVLDDELSATLLTVAKDVKIQVEFNPACVSEYRLIGYEDRALNEQDFNNDKVDAGDIGAGHQVTALYEIVPAGNSGWLPDRHFDGNKSSPAPGNTGDAAFVKLRYKLPSEDTSRLIQQPITMTRVTSAKAPEGDTAFAAAVAAYGQILRNDTTLGNYTLADARALAGEQKGYIRSEFVELTKLAQNASPKP